MDSPPGPRSPRPWQFARFTLDFVRYLERCAARYGDVFTLRPPPFDGFVVATGPEEVHQILTDRDRFAGGDAAWLLEPVTGRGSVILAAGEPHMRQRKRLLPPFHGDRLARWQQEIAAIAERELDRLPRNEPIAMRPPMQRLTLEVICRIVLGMDDPDRIARFSTAFTRFLDPKQQFVLFAPTLTRRRGALNPARTFLRNRETVRRLLDEEIERSGDGEDVLSMMLRSDDDTNVRDELMGLLIAGHETTATGLAWAFERLSRTPGTQERLDDPAYLNAVVDETLRTRPPVIDAVRTATQDTTLGGRPVPEGTLVSAMFCITHRRADVWPDPLSFKPERFLDGKRAPYAYTPFGGGIRRCIGASLATLEMRTVLATAAQRFRIAPAPGPEERMRLSSVTLIPSRGGQVVLAAG
jgi:cytochrome P450